MAQKSRLGLQTAVRQAVKELIWYCLFTHNPDPNQRDIAIFGSRRSGSTWLMEIIAANKGIRFIDQPFSLFVNNPVILKYVPPFEYGQVNALDTIEEPLFGAYCEDLLNGVVNVNCKWKFWDRPWSFTTDRNVLKITDAKSVADYLSDRFKWRTIVLFRHPIAQAVSVARNRWHYTTPAFLRSADYCERYLNGIQIEFAWDLYRQGDDLKRRVLDWCLENLPLIGKIGKRRDWLFLGYEHLVCNPAGSIEKIAAFCGLEDVTAMKSKCARSSRSTKSSETNTKAQIEAGNREYLLNHWRSKISEYEERECFKILETFRIGLYRQGSNFAELSE